MNYKIEIRPDVYAVVDADDYKKFANQNWRLAKRGNTCYAVRFSQENGKSKSFYLHREILRPKGHEIVDHINGDGLDNRKINLRVATKSQNALNSRKHRENKTLGVRHTKGKRRKPYWAYIKHNGRQVSIGYYKTYEEAKFAYEQYRKTI